MLPVMLQRILLHLATRTLASFRKQALPNFTALPCWFKTFLSFTNWPEHRPTKPCARSFSWADKERP